MIRIAILAAAAAAVALPASAELSIRIPTAGKSPDQVRAEVVKAANSLCFRAASGATLPFEAQRACVKSTVRASLRQFAAERSTKLAER